MEDLTMANVDDNNTNNDRRPIVDKDDNNSNSHRPIINEDNNKNDNNNHSLIVDKDNNSNDNNNHRPIVDGNVNKDNANRRRSRPTGGKGRRKVEMKKIEKKSSLIVSFSKRRTGLFKKIEDFVKICGKKAAVITFSPHGKSFAVGYPSLDTVVEAYLQQMKRENQRPEENPGGEPWWKRSIEGMNNEELKKFKEALIVFRGNLEERLEEMKTREERTRDFLSLIGQKHVRV